MLSGASLTQHHRSEGSAGSPPSPRTLEQSATDITIGFHRSPDTDGINVA